MKVSDYTYNLPEELIAQYPPKVRGSSRLLVLNRQNGNLKHDYYKNLTDYLEVGDVLVLNDTKVIKARLVATNGNGQQREILLLEKHGDTAKSDEFSGLYRGKLHLKETLKIGKYTIEVAEINEGGIAKFIPDVLPEELSKEYGSVPLPPYMHREASEEDTQRYQTVFADKDGSVAAPTASLNFTDELKQQLIDKGVTIAYLTLHVGLGTFLPIRSDEVEGHKMHSEYFEIPESTVAAIQNAKRVVALGTTVARTLEYCAGQLKVGSKDLVGEADIFIYPGYKFKVVDVLITNFHAPKSTVLMLAAAFAGWDNLHHAYQEAIKEKYAFLSYGDSMLIL